MQLYKSFKCRGKILYLAYSDSMQIIVSFLCGVCLLEFLSDRGTDNTSIVLDNEDVNRDFGHCTDKIGGVLQSNYFPALTFSI